MPSIVTGMLCVFACIPLSLIAQKESMPDSITISISAKTSDKYINALGNRSAEYQTQMEQGTEKYLDKLKAQELILQQQLSKVNPEAATRIFNGSEQAYDKLQNDIKNNSESVLKSCGKYVPGIDSAITSLKFLQQNEGLTNKFGSNSAQITAAMSKVQTLEAQFTKTDNVEDFIKQRETYLQQQLSGYNLPGLAQYNQQAAYFGQQMTELKQDWDDPSRAEEKALSLLNKLPAFQNFMTKNSMIAGLFNIPDDYSTAGIAGLQTKDQVQKLMQQQMQLIGPNGTQSAQKSIGDAQSTLTSLRNKLNQGSGSDLAMPDGQSNNQHTKSLFRRLVYGVNIQSSMANSYYPQSTDFSLTVGYKINDKTTAGVGASYNVGWGSDIRHIQISNQGIGIRSYLDVQLKGSFFASGGFERNYNKVISTANQVVAGYLWQNSGLIGISKIVSLKSNFMKQTKVQLLWDFLSYYQIPKTSPWVFRVGYNF
jgi:hypothetical protein